MNNGWTITNQTDLNRIKNQYNPAFRPTANPVSMGGVPMPPPIDQSSEDWTQSTPQAPQVPEVNYEGVNPPAPTQNSMQRQQENANGLVQPELREVSPQRRYFWGTGRIDARPTQAPQNARPDFNALFGPNRTHMGTPSVTWAERQANNQAGVSGAKRQNGWSAY